MSAKEKAKEKEIEAKGLKNTANCYMKFSKHNEVEIGELGVRVVEMKTVVANVQKEAFNLYVRALKLGCYESALKLAEFYREGIVVDVDEVRANKLVRQAETMQKSIKLSHQMEEFLEE